MSGRPSDPLTWLKTLIASKFPPKPKKQIEDWDFIMVFEERYRDEMDRYFERYVDKYPAEGNRYQILSNEKEEQIMVLLSISDLNVEKEATELKMLKKKKKKSFNFTPKELNRQIYIAEE
jgi:hypothetical protein